MSKKSNKQRLKEALSCLKEGKGISLDKDIFLVTGGLDGSDKCYGFIKEGGKLLCITRECANGYPIEDMDKNDLDYIITSGIMKKLEATGKGYNIVESEEI